MNWALLQEQLAGKPVYKRAKHAIHFQNSDGSITANFSGKPCHYFDGGIWKAIDTTPLLGGDGKWGCPHSRVRIATDGTVSITGTDYAQQARLISPKNIKLDGDHLVRTFSGGEQRLYITEDGYRSEITLNSKPNLLQALYLLASVSGSLPGEYVRHPTVMTDADGKEYTYDNAINFRAWLDAAKYPVVIDPDFTGLIADGFIEGNNATYTTARDTSTNSGYTNWSYFIVGQSKTYYETYYVYRSYLVFDTSSIGANIVGQVNLKMTVRNDYSTAADFDVQIVKYNWSEWESNQTNTTYRETAYDGVLVSDADDAIWLNTNGISNDTTYISGNLSTAWINKTGKTYYALRSSRDLAGEVPSGDELLRIYSREVTTGSYRPVLSVTYATAGGHSPLYQNIFESEILFGRIVR